MELQSINSSHSQELSQVQIHAMETIEQMRERYESQLSTLRHNLETVQSTLQQKSTDYDQQLAGQQIDWLITDYKIFIIFSLVDVTLEKNQLDFKLRDVSRQHQAVSSDRDRLLQECEQAAASNTQLENEKSSLQKEIVKLDAQIGSLLQQIQSKEEVSTNRIVRCLATFADTETCCLWFF